MNKRNYELTLNVTTGKIKIPQISIYNTDKGIFNIKLFLEKGEGKNIVKLTHDEMVNYKALFQAVKSKTKNYVELEGILDETENFFYYDLGSKFNDQVGVYNCQIFVTDTKGTNDNTADDEIVTSVPFNYSVTASILTGLNTEITANPDLPVLKELINECKILMKLDSADMSVLNPFQKKEDSAINGTDKNIISNINNINSQIKEMENEVGTEILPTTSQTLKGSISELFQSASSGKTLIANAITGKGVATSNTDTFQTMATNIMNISSTSSTLDISYTFNNDIVGSADGNIKLKASDDTLIGTYSLYWGYNNEKISGYEKLGDIELIDTIEKSISMFEKTIIPVGVNCVVAEKNGVVEKTLNIPNSKILDSLGNKLYTFSVISDIHNNTNNTWSARDDMYRTLEFLHDKSDFVCVTGDVAHVGVGINISEFQTKLTELNFEGYACPGNHDSFSAQDWLKYIGSNINTHEVIKNDDVFLFLNVINTNENDIMSWLNEKLIQHKGKKIFLFMHYPLPNTAGLKTGQYYGFSSNSTFASLLRSAINDNKNAMLFTGHTHFRFNVQDVYPNINVYDADGIMGATIHVPSNAYPRDAEGNELTDFSEGYIIDVYSKKVILKGVNFMNGKYLPYAQYIISPDLTEPTYKQIIINKIETSINENANDTFTVKLDSAPLSNQIVTLSIDNNNVGLDKSSLTFTPSNWNVEQIVTITPVHDTNSFSNKSSVITINSDGVLSKTVSVTIVNIDEKPTVIPITNISVNGSSKVYVGQSITLTAILTPNEATESVIWEIDNNNCEITSNGLNATITGALEGTTIVSVSNTTKTITCNYTISVVTIDYVTEGLEFYLDSLQNGANNLVWDDLSGNNIHMEMKGFTDKVLSSDGGIVFIPANSTYLVNKNACILNSDVDFTLEFYGKILSPEPTGMNYVYYSGVSGAKNFVSLKTTQVYYNLNANNGAINNVPGVNNDLNHYYIIRNVTNGTLEFYMNNTFIKSTNKGSVEGNAVAPLVIGAKYSMDADFANIQINKYRIYKRILTEEERLKNYNSCVK